jgi:bifunctional phosphoglucose/phosphomannose isomerase
MKPEDILNDNKRLQAVDKAGMLELVGRFPQMLEEGYRLGRRYGLPAGEAWAERKGLILAGMGGSAIGGDLIRTLYAKTIPYPLEVVRAYKLPGWVNHKTLVISLSYSGDTAETLALTEEALAEGASCIAVSSGGKLKSLIEAPGNNGFHINLPGGLPPRAALGYLFGVQLAVLQHLGWLPDMENPLREAVIMLQGLQKLYGSQNPYGDNEAKRLAGLLHNKQIVLWGVEKASDAAALRWKTQLEENSKLFALHNSFPELCHNEIVGIMEYTRKLEKVAAVFLRTDFEDERIKKTIAVAKDLLHQRGHLVEEVHGQGNTELEQLLSLIHLGDFVSTYLAVLRGVDPTPVESIRILKERVVKEERPKVKKTRRPGERVKAVIIAGGEGTRLRPLTYHVPKALIPIMGRPLIEYQLELLKHHGIYEVILNLYHQAEVIKDCLGNGSRFGINIEYSQEDSPRGTAGAVKIAEKLFSQSADLLVVFNGDILTDLNLSELLNYHREKKARATLTLARVDDPTAYGLVLLEDGGKIKRFLEKPSAEEAVTDTINAGTYVLDPRLFDYVPPNEPYSFERGLFPTLLQVKEPFFGFVPRETYWLDVGTPKKYMAAHRDILDGRIKANLAPVEHRKNIWQAKGVEIDPAAVLKGPLYLGKGVRVGKRARIGEYSVLEDNVVVGEGVQIKGSLIGKNTNIAEESQIFQSMIGADSRIEERAYLSGGVLLGNGSIISRGSRLESGELKFE